MEEDEVEDDNIPDFAQYVGFEGNQTSEEERDADGNDVADDLDQMLQDAKEDCESEKGAHKLDKMLEDHRTSLYPGCEQGHKKLDTTLEFLQWKAKNGISDKTFGDLLKLVKNILSEGNKLLETTYEAKKIVCPLGLEVQKIHACPNNCILYRGPKQPGNDIDVYLRPLVEDLKLLWKKEDVPVWDEDKQEEFNLRALLFVAINDWPALSNVSGQSNKGYKACTHCMDETESVYGKSKDTLEARNNLKHMEQRDDLHLEPKEKGSNYLSPASYTLSKAEKEIVIRGILPNNVRTTITKLCAFMNAISQKVIDPDRLEALQNDVVQCLVSFELIFPPSFFNIMTHLLCHLVKEISILGPVYLHNMFILESYMGVLKKYVCNRARPEASIAKGYGTEEVIEFCVEFIEDLRPIGIPESRIEGRLRRKGTLGRKAIMTIDNNLFRKTHFTVLQQSSLVAPYIEEHLALVRARNIAQDIKSTNQNSAVRVDAMGHNGTTGMYYGAIEDIWELDYGPLKVPLFRCQWVRLTGGGVMVDDSGMTTVDLNKVGYSDEPFVLANDVTQVFYVKDMSSKGKKGRGPDEPKRHVVLPGKRKIIGVEDKTDEDYDQLDEQPPFTVTIDPKHPPIK
uniref:Transposon protein, putative, CACTA, En/Spm sub-class n=1 Tax=Oryza sativa subsp. japonica TaxID=39947 RepID=Q2QTM1_ORYSJ|nr:transposon protein, putative, CACTA, En/Spm sub-class [Oryza sativa Japonica Group]